MTKKNLRWSAGFRAGAAAAALSLAMFSGVGCSSARLSRPALAPGLARAVEWPFSPLAQEPGAEAREMLGVNLGYEEPHSRSGGAMVGYYMMNRFFDFVDIFTATVGAGPIAHAEIHITDFFRLGLGLGWQITFGLAEAPREYGLYGRKFGEIAFGPGQIGFIGHDHFIEGSVPYYSNSYEGLMKPEDSLYHEKRDYWSLGIGGGFPVFGGQFAIHPLQIFDFFAGWVMFDPLRDDL